MEEKKILQIILGEFHDKLKLVKNMLPRAASFAKADNKIKVAIGMRRAGKTYFIYQKILNILNNHTPLNQILYINFEDDRLLPLDIKKMANLIESFYSLYPQNHEKQCYIFLDEVQNIENWAIVVRRLFDTKNIQLFLTGSSSKLLSKEIATNLRGRSLATEIWPYSFKEFMKSKNFSIDQKLFSKKSQDHLFNIFTQYLSEGGFPEVTKYEKNVRKQTLQEYLDVVIYRDIIERHKIKNPALIKYMIIYLIHNVGNPLSINKFYNEAKVRGYKTSKDSLYEYASYIEDIYLCFFVSLYDKSLRKTESNPKKIYAIDTGMIRALTLDYENDLGRLFENIIYLELRRLGCHVNYYLTSERYEIDFIVKTPQGHKKFFQVVWDMKNPKTCHREQRALEAGIKEQGIIGEIITLESFLKNGINLN